MPQSANKPKKDRSLNLFVSYELKRSLEELATKLDCPTATVVRTLLKIAVPILQGVWQAEQSLAHELPSLLRRPATDDSPGDCIARKQPGAPLL